MDITQLKCFIAVVQTLNFTEAAKRNNMTQPGISHHLGWPRRDRASGSQIARFSGPRSPEGLGRPAWEDQGNPEPI